MEGKLTREEVEAYYESLTLDERRQRLILEPRFRDAYNEITQAHRIVPVPQYFWEKWAAVLGPVATVLYQRLRQYCFYDPRTGQGENWCWPRQDTLAKEIGVGHRHTVMKALKLLEDYGFIKREKQFHKRGKRNMVKRGSDKYIIYFEIPLTKEDAIELFHRRMEEMIEESTDMSKFSTYRDFDVSKKSTYRENDVDNSSDMSKISTFTAVENFDSRIITRNISTNVNNVIRNKSGRKKSSFREHPAIANLSPDELDRKEFLATEIGEQLKRMSGNRDMSSHPSLGFHRRVAYLVPEAIIMEALAATRDAVDDQHGGRKLLRNGASAYFAGTIQKMAAREGIDLGIKRK
ncbi:MAG: hypothetical protein DRP46_11765 [Candidatus Zixiibacteriota bacterium]|nr:MAG: hypothetical protein DRP46_11765 [candidate division Zixibacteria bacterium]